MDEQILIYAAILVAVIVLTIVGILSRYRKCKSDEVLVVYGKTGDKKSAKLYHGGAAFVWPIIQGYSFLNMKPMQIDCKLTGAISKQNIRVDVPTTITVAVSTEPEVMQNAAERLLGLNIEAQQELIKGEFYQFNSSSCIRQQNSLTAQFVSFSLSNLANIFYPPNFYNN